MVGEAARKAVEEAVVDKGDAGEEEGKSKERL